MGTFKVTAYGKVEIDFCLDDISVEETGRSYSAKWGAVEARVRKIITDKLGVHDYVYGPKFGYDEIKVTLSDFEGN